MANHTNQNKELELAQIVERLKLGDEKAREELYKYYYPKLKLIAYRYFKDEEKAKDAVQETFVKVMKNLDSVQTNLGAYLIKVLYNTCNTIYKRETLWQRYLAGKEFFTSTYLMHNDIDTKLLTKRILRCLTEEQHKVFSMKREGYKLKEISREINKSEVNTRQILFSARKKLQQDPIIKEMIS